MRPRLLVVALALAAAGASTAHADDPQGSGVIVSAGVSGAIPFYATAEASAGWRPIAPLAIIARVSGNAAERDAWADLQLGVRGWPDPVAGPGVSFELRGGLLKMSEELDCRPLGPDRGECWGGKTTGLAFGAAMRLALARGRHASLDVLLGVESLRFRDGSTDIPEAWHSARVGIGASFF